MGACRNDQSCKVGGVRQADRAGATSIDQFDGSERHRVDGNCRTDGPATLVESWDQRRARGRPATDRLGRRDVGVVRARTFHQATASSITKKRTAPMIPSTSPATARPIGAPR